MAKGTIKKLFERYGYIQPDDGGKDVFFHFTLLKGNSVRIGQQVEFESELGEKGLRARWLKVIDANQKAAAATDEAGRYRFSNPYNFVRTIQKKREKGQILGDCPPPPHDRYVGLTGRIACEAEVVTPLFISDSHAIKKDDEEKDNGHWIYRFFQYKGKPAIPASSLRGMVRSVFEALTNSCFAVFQRDGEWPLEHRVAQAPPMVPARVVEINREGGACLELLDCTENPQEGVSLPSSIIRKTIKAGLVKRAYPPSVEKFDPNEKELPPGAYDGMRVAALVKREPIPHSSNRFHAFHVTAIEPVVRNQPLYLKENKDHVLVYGWLHLTGPNIENKHDERLFFRWGDKNPDPPHLKEIPVEHLCECDRSVVEEYNRHLNCYWERLGSKVKELGDQRWPKGNANMPQPSIFVEQGRILREGDLVYVWLAEKAKRRGKLLRPVAMPRIPYKHGREKFLPDHLKQRCTSYEALCPACRVFGWVHEKAEEMDRDRLVAYAGRVRFSHGEIEEPFQVESEITLAILSTPKPTTTPFYLLDQNGNPDPLIDYDKDGAHLRGRKIYRHHGKANPDEYQRAVKDKQNRTIVGALKTGTRFTFTVEFENLAPIELGTLLYALELEDLMVHRLGLAKPLGFGSIRVRVKEVKTINWATRLSYPEKEAGWRIWTVDEWKRHEKEFLYKNRNLYGEEFDNVLADLRSLLGPPTNKHIHYPRPFSVLTEQHPQYEWFVGNKRRCEKARRNKQDNDSPAVPLPLASKDAGLPLMNKYGKDVLR